MFVSSHVVVLTCSKRAAGKICATEVEADEMRQRSEGHTEERMTYGMTTRRSTGRLQQTWGTTGGF